MDKPERHDDELLEIPQQLPLVPLRDVVLLPGAVVPLLVGRERSVRSLELASDADKLLAVTVQLKPETTDPSAKDLRDIGTVARIHQMLRLPDGTTKILVEGLHRIRINSFVEATDHLAAVIELVEAEAASDPTELEALLRQSVELFGQYASAQHRLPDEVVNSVNQIGDGLRRADAIGSWMVLPAPVKQELLEEIDPLPRYRRNSHSAAFRPGL